MKWQEFNDTFNLIEPPELPPILKALWYDGKGNWHEAHQIAQDIPSKEGSLIHAYLHRKEGDFSNARYWYQQAGRTMPSYAVDKEWEELVKYFLIEVI